MRKRIDGIRHCKSCLLCDCCGLGLPIVAFTKTALHQNKQKTIIGVLALVLIAVAHLHSPAEDSVFSQPVSGRRPVGLPPVGRRAPHLNLADRRRADGWLILPEPTHQNKLAGSGALEFIGQYVSLGSKVRTSTPIINTPMPLRLNQFSGPPPPGRSVYVSIRPFLSLMTSRVKAVRRLCALLFTSFDQTRTHVPIHLLLHDTHEISLAFLPFSHAAADTALYRTEGIIQELTPVAWATRDVLLKSLIGEVIGLIPPPAEPPSLALHCACRILATTLPMKPPWRRCPLTFDRAFTFTFLFKRSSSPRLIKNW